MRVPSRVGPVALVLVAAFGVTCSKEASGPPAIVPETLATVSGNNQSAFTGDSVPDPLIVRVTGSDGQPFDSAVVTWTVTSGTATVGSATAVTDFLGLATTTVALGGTPGLVSVQASVVGLQPASFIVRACDHPAIALGDTVSGALATTDCRLAVWYTDFLELAVPAGPQGVTLTMTSGVFDTYLELYRQAGTLLAGDDDIDATNQNSQLAAILGTGDYVIAPSSFDTGTVGAYTLAAVARQTDLVGCEVVWVTRGIAVSDSVTTNDCVDSTGGPFYADAVALNLEAGSVLTVRHASTAFDAALFLNNAGGAAVASNNDSANAGTTTNAYLVFPVALTGSYLLFAGTNVASATGPYTLTISASTTLSGTAQPGGGGRPQVLRMPPLRMPKGLPRRGWRR